MCLYMDDNEGGTISVLGRVVSVDLGKTDPDDDSNSVTEISPHEPYITVALAPNQIFGSHCTVNLSVDEFADAQANVSGVASISI